ncbi:MAG: PadR family transcriptional regulator [Pseudomonadota bacterium]
MASKEKHLGEFEHIVLLALVRLGEDAYGMNVRTTLKKLIDRDTSIGSLYATLERLESKGYVTSLLGEATAERGGRAKRFFKVTADGMRVLRATKGRLEVMWEGVLLTPQTQAGSPCAAL